MNGSDQPTMFLFGEARVDRIPEAGRVAYDPEFLFRDTAADVVRCLIKDNLPWMAPWSVDAQSLHIYLSFQSFVVRFGGKTILVDACNGNDKHRTDMPKLHLLSTPFMDRMSSVGVVPESIDYVLCTHLHADHVGWNTRLSAGRWVPTFPNARYIVSQTELDFWQARHRANPSHAINHGSFEDSVLPVIASGQMDAVDCEHVIHADGRTRLRLAPAKGHTPGSVHVELSSMGQSLIFSADTIHHPLQIVDPDIGIFADICPVRAMQTRIQLIERVQNSNELLLPAHFSRAGRIVHANGCRKFVCADF
jgi:glyoxylase-like metal-dependent hydrolase (beta-lactamase superfamily II)